MTDWADKLAYLIDAEGGLLRGEIFRSQEIYERELATIFARSWVFLAHDTMIPRPGDFLQNYIGEDPVIIARQKDGAVLAYINQCQHRGMRLCRADRGRAKNFMCSFHGWSYDLAGKLVSAPHGAATYAADDLAGVQLRRVRLHNHKGFIFGTWSDETPDFDEYLGDFKWYLDAYIDRFEGGLEVVGVHKWVLPCNWKFNAEQPTSDMYHAETSHMSAMQVMLPRDVTGQLEPWAAAEVGLLAKPEGGQFASPLGHGAGWYKNGMMSFSKTIHDWNKTHREAIAQRLGETRVTIPGHANLFPNFMMLANSTFRVTHPRGPNEMEIWSWSMAPVNAPPEVKEAIRVDLLRTFSAGGMLEQDDAVNWEEQQAVFRGFIARNEQMKYRQMQGQAQYDQNGWPGKTVKHVFSDQAARDMYLHYSDMMSGRSWAELLTIKRARTEAEKSMASSSTGGGSSAEAANAS